MSLESNNQPPHRSAAQGPQSHKPREGGESARFAHELANLLDGSLRNLGLALNSLRDSIPPDADVCEDATSRLESADQAMRRMAMIVRQWLDQREATMPVHHETRSLSETIAHAVRLLYPAAQHHGIHIKVDVDSAVADLPGGPVYTVVANAVRNSIEAITGRSSARDREAEGWAIHVEARQGEDDIVIEVRDNGPGLDESLLDDGGQFAFGRTTKPSGHGLGLALCRDVARSLGGRLTLENTSPRGSCLRLTYPIRRDEDEQEA